MLTMSPNFFFYVSAVTLPPNFVIINLLSLFFGEVNEMKSKKKIKIR